ncbi:Conserved hypothetical protein [Prochlorococcus marinus str. MIT 9313]|uniref:Uncharacterized protein n=1 Tax=Prochlorococcus marinus (strain MIT 9313) TaxID=74547 RepID=B9ES98_PROMM|nr:Conserved hypothetical protein [Prochlorococcus marinus str. MIT 9313]
MSHELEPNLNQLNCRFAGFSSNRRFLDTEFPA